MRVGSRGPRRSLIRPTIAAWTVSSAAPASQTPPTAAAPQQQAGAEQRPEGVREREAEAREPHQREPRQHRPPRAEMRGSEAAEEPSYERAARVGGDEDPRARLGEPELVQEVRQQRRQRRVQHRVDEDEGGGQDQQTAHRFQPTLSGVTNRGRGAVQTGVNAASPPLSAPVASRSGFAEIVAGQLDAVYSYVVYLTGDRSAAEDI